MMPRHILTAALAIAAAGLGGVAGASNPGTRSLRTSGTRPLHTYSIIAFDRDAGEMGVAVQSHWFNVGSVVSWAESGAGVVATQSFAEPAYGPRGLQLMRSGVPAPDALRALVSVDSSQAVRQVAFVDCDGRIGVHTGSGCIEWAGHSVGENYAVQANLMRSDAVVPAMARAYESATGDLADRLLAALEAAEAAGGDIRGRQSAAMLIVRITAGSRPWEDRLVDLRVDDHVEPLAELRRLLVVHRAYAHMNAGDRALESGDPEAAMAAYAAAADLAPDNLEVTYWHAITMATNGRVADALPLFRRVFEADPGWIEVTRRLRRPGIIPGGSEGEALLARILAVAR